MSLVPSAQEQELKGSNAMLKLASEKGVRPIIGEVFSMKDAAKAIKGVKDNSVRYRYVLKQDLA